jgi:hypothetical protein
LYYFDEIKEDEVTGICDTQLINMYAVLVVFSEMKVPHEEPGGGSEDSI